MSDHAEQPISGLQERQCAALALPSSGCAQVDDLGDDPGSKPANQSRSEKTGYNRPGRSSMHSVFVLDVNGNPLTPTKPAKARKLLKEGKATKVWSKFGTFGIRLNVSVEVVYCGAALGVDPGTKFEGYSVVVNYENNLNVKLDLPDKKKIVKKMEQRRILRRRRRHWKCRRRPARFQNRSRREFIAPSQMVMVKSRLKIIQELCRIYPVFICGLEDVKFNHTKKKWGSNFSTMEIGKSLIRRFFQDYGIVLWEYQGHETSEYRKIYGYKKINNKSKDQFESHCCDSLTLACTVVHGYSVEPGSFLVVNDTYRPVRRQLHDMQPAQGDVREKFSTGTVKELRKGLLIGTPNRQGQLCGFHNPKVSFRYYDKNGERRNTKEICWVSSSFMMRGNDSVIT